MQMNILYSYLFFIFCTRFQKKTCHYMQIWMFLTTLSHFEWVVWIFLYDEGLANFGENNYIYIWKEGLEHLLEILDAREAMLPYSHLRFQMKF